MAPAQSLRSPFRSRSLQVSNNGVSWLVSLLLAHSANSPVEAGASAVLCKNFFYSLILTPHSTLLTNFLYVLNKKRIGSGSLPPGRSIFKIYSRQYHKITIEDNFVQYFGLRHIKFSGFRKGVRGRTLFPPEKGFPRVTCRPKLIYMAFLKISLFFVINCNIMNVYAADTICCKQ